MRKKSSDFGREKVLCKLRVPATFGDVAVLKSADDIRSSTES